MAHVSALGLVILVCCSMLQQMDVESEEDRVNTTTCMPGTYDKKIFIDDEKAMLIPTQVSREGRITTYQAPMRSKLDGVAGVQRTSC